MDSKKIPMFAATPEQTKTIRDSAGRPIFTFEVTSGVDDNETSQETMSMSGYVEQSFGKHLKVCPSCRDFLRRNFERLLAQFTGEGNNEIPLPENHPLVQ